MTRDEFDNIALGTRMRIGLEFVEDPHDSLTKYLGTVQVLERVDASGTGWAYFEGLHQPFAFSEIEGIEYDCQCIDDASTPYDCGDISLIFGGAT